MIVGYAIDSFHTPLPLMTYLEGVARRDRCHEGYEWGEWKVSRTLWANMKMCRNPFIISHTVFIPIPHTPLTLVSDL